jgi:hypothetical protein
MKRRLTVACVLVFGLAFLLVVPAHYAQVTKKLILNAIFTQENSPVELISVTSDVDYLFSKAEVKNNSDKTIQSITVGVFTHENAGEQKPILTRHELFTDIKPGASRSVDTFGILRKLAHEQTNQMKSNPITLDFGILQVQFIDGSSWHSTAETTGAFPPEKSSSLGKKTVGTLACSRTTLADWLGRIVPSGLVPSVLAQGGGVSLWTHSKRNHLHRCPYRDIVLEPQMQSPAGS